MLLNILAWVVVGGLAGWVASKIMKTDAQMGLMMNVVVGVIGAVVGGYLVGMLTGSDVNTFSIGGFIVAVLGAVLLIGVVKALTGRKAV